MQLFFNSEITAKTNQVVFDKNESRHIVRVLRKTMGNKLIITNGKGNLFTAEITQANDKKCLAQIVHIENKPKPWNYYLHVAIAPTKLNNRFEWFLEKATEIGIDEITPIICEHSERTVLKLDRMEKIIQSAAKQSLKFYYPKLNEVVLFNDFIKSDFGGQLFIAHCEKFSKKLLKSVAKPSEKTTILIGPEGDFSISEIEKSIQKNFVSVSLGESRLRTETAGIVAVHSVAFINE